MEANRNVHGCDKCKSHQHDALEQAGEPEDFTYFGGKAHETQTRYRCKFCGAMWINFIESGLGGHGNTWAPTK